MFCGAFAQQSTTSRSHKAVALQVRLVGGSAREQTGSRNSLSQLHKKCRTELFADVTDGFQNKPRLHSLKAEEGLALPLDTL